ncbi:hypothetical protein DQK91_01200 [Oceanidesulfovibrio marinus]|uniref:Uncharacterized protein n=1 Tax=Oceanidesulfovibrio marinus TaxID=370038 RepID=A0A6P1ZLB6_9BACT|nr:hypothetical protein DQK91_01200 [Oceanidesulfovibrio marinus]
MVLGLSHGSGKCAGLWAAGEGTRKRSGLWAAGEGTRKRSGLRTAGERTGKRTRLGASRKCAGEWAVVLAGHAGLLDMVLASLGTLGRAWRRAGVEGRTLHASLGLSLPRTLGGPLIGSGGFAFATRASHAALRAALVSGRSALISGGTALLF